MFKLFRKSVGVNTAIGALGIDINHLDTGLRQQAIQLASENNYTNQEAAVFVYYQLPAALRPTTGAEVINIWTQSGKIRKGVLSASAAGHIHGTDYKHSAPTRMRRHSKEEDNVVGTMSNLIASALSVQKALITDEHEMLPARAKDSLSLGYIGGYTDN